ncbi:MAG: hypothetical protein K6F80_04860 [Oscillospiraceae bacterium]|jgi:hypothetical protein|nr:hypothetical protein [Oscillospiraceae bacterium]
MRTQTDKKTRTKTVVFLILLLLMMLIPMRIQMKDGGTVDYKAMLYSVRKWHALTVEDHRTGVLTGTQVHILFWDVYNNVHFVPDNIETVLSPADKS